MPLMPEGVETDLGPLHDRIAQAGARELWSLLAEIEKMLKIAGEFWCAIYDANEAGNAIHPLDGPVDGGTLDDIREHEFDLRSLKCEIFNRVMADPRVAVEFLRLKFVGANG